MNIVGKRVVITPTFNHGSSTGTVLAEEGVQGLDATHIYTVRLDNGDDHSYAAFNLMVIDDDDIDYDSPWSSPSDY